MLHVEIPCTRHDPCTQAGSAALQAQLRAATLSALRSEEGGQGRWNPQADWLLATEEGVSVLALVRELLEWAGLHSTVQVFDAEVGHDEPFGTREELSEQLVACQPHALPALHEPPGI